MKKVLIISFDLIRSGEVAPALGVGSLIAYLKANPGYGFSFSLDHHTINMEVLRGRGSLEDLEEELASFELESYDTVAVSCYIWNEYLLPDLFALLKNHRFKGKLALGGYQITYGQSKELERQYPMADFFIYSYGEKSILEAINAPKPLSPVHLTEAIDFSQLPSPYLTGVIPIPQDQKMLRFETKRGCPYRCSFCAHRDLITNKVYGHKLEKVYKELAMFKEKKVRRINVLDPTFNQGPEYLKVLREMERLDIDAEVTLQSRFELIRREEGEEFLDLADKLSLHLEFGIQTLAKEEYKVIERPNNILKIEEVMKKLAERNISYEISLIYGLPNQTFKSFKNNLLWLQDRGAQTIKAYPLMLLRGTKLHTNKKKWGFQESAQGEFQIPIVTSSHSFSNNEWRKMDELAKQLAKAERIL